MNTQHTQGRSERRDPGKRHLPPVVIRIYARDTENRFREERRLNEGVDAGTAAGFALPVAGVRRREALDTLTRYAFVLMMSSGFLGLFAGLAGLTTAKSIDSMDAVTAIFAISLFGVAAIAGITSGILFCAACKSEARDQAAAADRAVPYLGSMPIRVTDVDGAAFESLRIKLEHSRRSAAYSPAREAELFIAVRTLADYRRTPAPDPTAKRMEEARHLFSDRAVKQLARQYREAKAAKAVAYDRAVRLVDAFGRSVADENLVATARKRALVNA